MIDEEIWGVGERAARDAVTGETYYVPGDMTYEEWKKSFVEGGEKIVAKTNNSGIIKLTEEEEAAVKRYISSDAYKINAALRETEDISALDAEKQTFIRDLDSALKKFHRYEGTVVRTLNFSDFSDGENDLNDFLRQHEVGNTLSFPQYISTSKTSGYDETADVVVYILNGKNGRDLSSFNSAEQEILYERNSIFTVLQKKNNNGIWVIYLIEGT